MVALLAPSDETVSTRFVREKFAACAAMLTDGQKDQLFVTNYGQPLLVMMTVDKYLALKALEDKVSAEKRQA